MCTLFFAQPAVSLQRILNSCKNQPLRLLLLKVIMTAAIIFRFQLPLFVLWGGKDDIILQLEVVKG